MDALTTRPAAPKVRFRGGARRGLLPQGAPPLPPVAPPAAVVGPTVAADPSARPSVIARLWRPSLIALTASLFAHSLVVWFAPEEERPLMAAAQGGIAMVGNAFVVQVAGSLATPAAETVHPDLAEAVAPVPVTAPEVAAPVTPEVTPAPAPPAAAAPVAAPAEPQVAPAAAPSPAAATPAPTILTSTSPEAPATAAPVAATAATTPAPSAAPAAPAVQPPTAAAAATAPPVETVTAADPDTAVAVALRPPSRPDRREPEPQERREQPAPEPASPGNAAEDSRTGTATGEQSGTEATAGTQAAAQPAQEGNAAADNYPGEVMRRLSRIRPERIRAEGVAVIAFRIAADGSLAAVSVAQSSGNAEIDQAGVNHVARAAPFPAPPAGAQTSFSFQFGSD